MSDLPPRNRPREIAIMIGTAVFGAAAGVGLTLATRPLVGNDRSKFLLGGAAIISALISRITFAQALIGWAFEEETNRRVAMSRTERIVWLTAGVVLLVVTAFVLPNFDAAGSDNP